MALHKELSHNRTYKARIFEMLYREKEEALELYNAVNETTYEDPEQLEIVALDNAIYMSMKNDVSFLIDCRLSVYEQQSTYNPNMPLLNINQGHNQKLLESCKSLRDYAQYTARVRRYALEQPIEEAVERAIGECIEEGILAEFLKRNRAEAIKMSIYEYDEEKHMRQEREEWEEIGWKAGRKAGQAEGEARISGLIKCLVSSGRADEIERAAEDENFRERLYKEFSIE